jgi:SH3 domain-containing protein
MPDKRVPIPDTDPNDLDNTPTSNPLSQTQSLSQTGPTLPAGRGHVQPATQSKATPPAPPPQPARLPEKPKRGGRKPPPPPRRDSGLYLPLWSVALMLLIVVGIAFGIIFIVLSLGGNAATGGSPRVLIITAQPSITPNSPPTQQSPQPILNPQNQGPLPTFALEGPTLQPVVLSPTPEEVAVGKVVTVIVSSVNVRSAAGRGNDVLFTGSEGDTFTVTGGPTQSDGVTWWQVQNTNNGSQSGWVAQSDGEQDLIAVRSQATPGQ